MGYFNSHISEIAVFKVFYNIPKVSNFRNVFLYEMTFRNKKVANATREQYINDEVLVILKKIVKCIDDNTETPIQRDCATHFTI
jgi:hypothetical protein